MSSPVPLFQFPLAGLFPADTQLSVNARDRIATFTQNSSILFQKQVTAHQMHVLLPLLASHRHCPYEAFQVCIHRPGMYEAFLSFLLSAADQRSSSEVSFRSSEVDFRSVRGFPAAMERAHDQLQAAEMAGCGAWKMEVLALRNAIRKLNRGVLASCQLRAVAVPRFAYLLTRTEADTTAKEEQGEPLLLFSTPRLP